MEEQLRVEKYFWANSLLTTSSTKSSELPCFLQLLSSNCGSTRAPPSWSLHASRAAALQRTPYMQESMCKR